MLNVLTSDSQPKDELFVVVPANLWGKTPGMTAQFHRKYTVILSSNVAVEHLSNITRPRGLRGRPMN